MLDLASPGRSWALARYESEGNPSRTAAYKAPNRTPFSWNRSTIRAYVGGLWAEIGRLQFEFLLRQGLAPSDCFLDIACGSLSRGRPLYLTGLNRQLPGYREAAPTVELGIEKELGQAVFSNRNRSLFSPGFRVPSVFQDTQLPDCPVPPESPGPSDIHTCLRNLREFVKDGHVAFATSSKGILHANAEESHPHVYFHYSRRKWMPSAVLQAGSRLTSAIGTIPGTR